MPHRIATFIDSHTGQLPRPLPMTYVTRGRDLQPILLKKQLETRWCEWMEQELVYTFYGRPAYRPTIPKQGDKNSRLQAHNDTALMPVCFLLNMDKVAKPTRQHPFDTGVFLGGLLGEDFSLIAGMSEAELKARLPDFLLTNTPENPRRFVKAFFATNIEYFRGRPRKDNTIPFNGDDARYFYEMASKKGRSNVDDRKSTLEYQFDKPIPLTSQTVMAVFLPEARRDDQHIMDLVTGLGLTTLCYDDHKASHSEHMGALRAQVRQFLEDKKLLPPMNPLHPQPAP